MMQKIVVLIFKMKWPFLQRAYLYLNRTLRIKFWNRLQYDNVINSDCNNWTYMVSASRSKSKAKLKQNNNMHIEYLLIWQYTIFFLIDMIIVTSLIYLEICKTKDFDRSVCPWKNTSLIHVNGIIPILTICNKKILSLLDNFFMLEIVRLHFKG